MCGHSLTENRKHHLTHVILRRKLVKVTYTDEQMRNAGIDPEEERRKRSREIINAIPTDKDSLFARKMHWEAMDQALVDSRLKPYVFTCHKPRFPCPACLDSR